MSPWPELEQHLTEQAWFDLIDEFADEPDPPFPLRARTDQGEARTVPAGEPVGRHTQRPCRETTVAGPLEEPAAATPLRCAVAVTPRALGASPCLQPGPRGVHNLTRWQRAHEYADCHAGEPAAGWVPGHGFICNACRYPA